MEEDAGDLRQALGLLGEVRRTEETNDCYIKCFAVGDHRAIPSTVRWNVGDAARLGCDPPSADVMLLSWPGLVDLGAGGVVCVCGRAA